MTKNSKNVTVKDAARYFWGKAQFEYATNNKLEKVQSDICMLSDSFATNGSFIIYGAGELEFELVKNSRYCDMPREQIKPVIMPYINASICAKVPASLFGHLAAGHSKKIYLAAAGRWCSFVVNDADHGMHMEDGADMVDFFNLGGIKATFDGSEIAKIFKKFKVDGVEICRPSKGSDFMRFYFTFKGAKFTAILLKCYRDDYNADYEDEALKLVEKWDREDVKRTQEDKNNAEVVAAVANYPTAPVAACEAPRTDDNNDQESAENTEKNGVKIVKNAEFGSVEIYFKEKPSQEVRDTLKGCGYLWHGVKKCWYGYTDETTARHMIEAAEGVEAMKAGNVAETAQEGENARGGAEVCPEAETAPEAKETAKRDLSKEFRRGDVVRITGTTNGRNGFFYVVDLHDDGTPYKLQGLKKVSKYDYFKDELTKTVEYWPLHTYASSPKVRAEFKEAVKGARLTNYGPKSVAAYQEVKRQYEETVETLRQWKEERAHDDYWVNYWTKAEADERADVERMRAEAPELESLKQWKETHQKPEGPGLKIWRHGLKVRKEDGTWKHYSLTIEKAHGYRNDAHEGEIEVYGSYYHGSNEIPGGFGLGIINDSDSQTDYFVADRAFVKPDHPLFWAFAQAAEGGKPYTLTDDDAKRCAEYLEQKRAEAEAKRIAEEEAERSEREAHYRDLDEKARESVATWSEAFPLATGVAPFVTVEWCEINAIHETGEEHSNEEGTPATRWSLDAFNMVTEDLDRYVKGCGWFGYFKLKYTVEFPDGYKYTDRIDLGDGVGGLVESARAIVKYNEDRKASGEEYGGTIYGGSVEDWRARLERLEAATDPDAVAMARGLLELGETA